LQGSEITQKFRSVGRVVQACTTPSRASRLNPANRLARSFALGIQARIGAKTDGRRRKPRTAYDIPSPHSIND
jgi:hypothetical protein